jgi:hypothetical protein
MAPSVSGDRSGIVTDQVTADRPRGNLVIHKFLGGVSAALEVAEN